MKANEVLIQGQETTIPMIEKVVGINQRTDTKWDSFTACGTIEGFINENPSIEQVVEAWAFLIMTGQCWNLQGMYGRGAAHMIQTGYIDKTGQIDWDAIDQVGSDN